LGLRGLFHLTRLRQAGYNGPIVIPGIDWANDLSQWLSHEPSDPLGQLLAEAHVYGRQVRSRTDMPLERERYRTDR
jgi:hypothetical protein